MGGVHLGPAGSLTKCDAESQTSNPQSCQRKKGAWTGKRQVVDEPSSSNHQSSMCAASQSSSKLKRLEKHPVVFRPYYKTLLPESLGIHCHEWPAGKANAEVQMLLKANSKPDDIVIYTDVFVTRDWSGWGVHSQAGWKNCAYTVVSTTSSLTMEVEAVTHTIQQLACQCHAQITHAIILIDSMNLLQKAESEMGCPDWHGVMHSL